MPDPTTPPTQPTPSTDWGKGYLVGVAAGGLAAMAGGVGTCSGCAAAGVSPDWGWRWARSWPRSPRCWRAAPDWR